MKRTRPAKRLIAIAATTTAVFFGACGGDSGSSEESAEPAGEEGQQVVMKLIAYKPEKLSVPAGSTVTWQQTDAGVHTVTSGTVRQEGGGVTPEPDSRFDSGEIATGKSFRFTFEDPGTFAYFCTVHPATMRGEVTVT